jgi:hypothetical protein
MNRLTEYTAKNILIASNRPLTALDAALLQAKAEEADMDVVVLAVRNDPERTAFLTEQVRLWKPHFDAL